MPVLSKFSAQTGNSKKGFNPWNGRPANPGSPFALLNDAVQHGQSLPPMPRKLADPYTLGSTNCFSTPNLQQIAVVGYTMDAPNNMHWLVVMVLNPRTGTHSHIIVRIPAEIAGNRVNPVMFPILKYAFVEDNGNVGNLASVCINNLISEEDVVVPEPILNHWNFVMPGKPVVVVTPYYTKDLSYFMYRRVDELYNGSMIPMTFSFLNPKRVAEVWYMYVLSGPGLKIPNNGFLQVLFARGADLEKPQDAYDMVISKVFTEAGSEDEKPIFFASIHWRALFCNTCLRSLRFTVQDMPEKQRLCDMLYTWHKRRVVHEDKQVSYQVFIPDSSLCDTCTYVMTVADFLTTSMTSGERYHMVKPPTSNFSIIDNYSFPVYTRNGWQDTQTVHFYSCAYTVLKRLADAYDTTVENVITRVLCENCRIRDIQVGGYTVQTTIGNRIPQNCNIVCSGCLNNVFVEVLAKGMCRGGSSHCMRNLYVTPSGYVSHICNGCKNHPADCKWLSPPTRVVRCLPDLPRTPIPYVSIPTPDTITPVKDIDSLAEAPLEAPSKNVDAPSEDEVLLEAPAPVPRTTSAFRRSRRDAVVGTPLGLA